jgi:hypothetical protein
MGEVAMKHPVARVLRLEFDDPRLRHSDENRVLGIPGRFGHATAFGSRHHELLAMEVHRVVVHPSQVEEPDPDPLPALRFTMRGVVAGPAFPLIVSQLNSIAMVLGTVLLGRMAHSWRMRPKSLSTAGRYGSFGWMMKNPTIPIIQVPDDRVRIEPGLDLHAPGRADRGVRLRESGVLFEGDPFEVLQAP